MLVLFQAVLARAAKRSSRGSAVTRSAVQRMWRVPSRVEGIWLPRVGDGVENVRGKWLHV